MTEEITLSGLEEAGINAAEAVGRLLGKERLYLKLLTEFHKKDFLQALHENLRQNNLDSAKISAHSLKGVAGNLGMENLMRDCDDLEKVLKSENWKAFQKAYDNLTSHYNSVMRAIEETLIGSTA